MRGSEDYRAVRMVHGKLFVVTSRETFLPRSSDPHLFSSTGLTSKNLAKHCEFIQHWTTMKNSGANNSEDNAIFAFIQGVRRNDLQEALGREDPKSIAHLMEIANKWADGKTQ